jgi:hypothetical protein
MNHIQKISRDLVSQRLKLQMGLDPQVHIEPGLLQAMWLQLQSERRAHQRSNASPGRAQYHSTT